MTKESLSKQTTKLSEEFLNSLPQDSKSVVTAAMEKLMASDYGAQALSTGDKIPAFTLPDAAGEAVAIYSVLAQGPCVISFYRGGWCPFCNLEFKALTDILPEINRMGANLIGISPEKPDVAQQTVTQHQIPFRVLSDMGNKIADQFGLVTEVYPEMRPLYLAWGLNLPQHNGDDSWKIPIPATYIVDTNGVIFDAFVNKDYTKRMEPANIIQALKRLS